jgi:hypothetical protein
LYNQIDDVKKDWKVLINNAILYNGETSPVVAHAKICAALWERAVLEQLKKVGMDQWATIRPVKDFTLDMQKVKPTQPIKLVLKKSNSSPLNATLQQAMPLSVKVEPSPVPVNVEPVPVQRLPHIQQPHIQPHVQQAFQRQHIQQPLQQASREESNLIVNILQNLLTMKDRTGRSLIDAFRELPSNELYPDYRTIIKQPVALSTIGEKLKRGNYSLNEFSKDIETMFRNAQTYNLPGSMVYEDAKVLHSEFRKLLLPQGSKMAKVPEKKTVPRPTAASPPAQKNVTKPQIPSVKPIFVSKPVVVSKPAVVQKPPAKPAVKHKSKKRREVILQRLSLPLEFEKDFVHEDGKVVFYSTPSLAHQPMKPLRHSEAYIEFKRRVK